MTITPFRRRIMDEEIKARIVEELAENASLGLAQYAQMALFDFDWPVKRLHHVLHTASRIVFKVGTGDRAS